MVARHHVPCEPPPAVLANVPKTILQHLKNARKGLSCRISGPLVRRDLGRKCKMQATTRQQAKASCSKVAKMPPPSSITLVLVHSYSPPTSYRTGSVPIEVLRLNGSERPDLYHRI
eukprot:scaffold36316_cov114-Isochrysis_galbana.AAC.7